MSGAFGSSQWMYSSGAAGFYPYELSQSLRFNDNDSAYLSRTPSSAGNRKTWTWSAWVKRSTLGTFQTLFSTNQSNNDATAFNFGFTSADKLVANPWNNDFVTTSAVFRDVSSWYHIVLEFDTTQSGSNNSDRINIYVNGVSQTLVNGIATLALNDDEAINQTEEHRIGVWEGTSWYFDGYMAEVNFIDGTALDATSFGETINGVWVPKAYSGSYGTNGFYLPFDDSAAIGDDESGNTNDFTASNLAASDVVTDSPTNNFATLYPIAFGSFATMSEGSLKIQGNTSSNNSNFLLVPRIDSGKWYFEARVNVHNTYGYPAFMMLSEAYDNRFYHSNGGSYWPANSLIVSCTSGFSTTNLGCSNGDIVGVAIDMDSATKTVKFYKNNTLTHTQNITTDDLVIGGAIYESSSLAIYNFGQDSTFAGNETAGGNADANGVGDFFYAPPASHLALCTANLPEPTLSPNAEEQADDYFNTVLYTANNNVAQSITGVGFQPDFLWIKERSTAEHPVVFDVVRGNTQTLLTSLTNVENTNTSAVTSFDSDGFSLGTDGAQIVNYLSETYVAWNWKAGGTAVSNTDGSITSSVSAAPDAGFSIVSYTGTGSSGTYGHGLGVAPNMIITKDRTDPAAWAVYVSDIGTGKYLELDQTDATTTAAAIYPSVSSTTIGVGVQGDGSLTNTSGDNYISYCFANVDGFSKVGSYVGNGSADGVFVFTNFEVKWLMVKRTDSTGSWNIADAVRSPDNEVDEQLQANLANAESTSFDFDFLSNGFKARTTDGARNASGGTYIYLAFGSSFKFANAR
mgnify:CR=1 FL=1